MLARVPAKGKFRRWPAALPGKPRILIVDDNNFVVILLQGLIGSTYEIEHAPGGEEGVACALQRPPSLVLMDVQMPGMNGY